MKISYCSKFLSYRYVLYSSLKLMAAHSVLVCRNLHLVNLSFVEKVSLHPTSSGGLEFESKLIQAPKFMLHWGLVTSWKNGAYWFASHDFLSLLYCTTKNHLPRVGNCPLWNEPSYINHQSSMKKIHHRLTYRPTLWRHSLFNIPLSKGLFLVSS